MGSKSSKSKEKNAEKAFEVVKKTKQPKKRNNSKQSNNSRAAAWPDEVDNRGRNHFHHNNNNNNNNTRPINRLPENDQWASSSYNLLDLHNNGGGGHNNNYEEPSLTTKYSKFANITNVRDQKEAESAERERRRTQPPRYPTPPQRRKKSRDDSPDSDRRRRKDSRHSDVSTISIEERHNNFKRGSRDRGSNSKFSRSHEQQHSRYKKSPTPPRRARSISPPRGKRTPPKVYPKHNRKAPKRYGGYGSGGSRSFTNLALVKSASQSYDSQVSGVSNFEQKTRVEKFNDKRESLRNVHLAKCEMLNNPFKDQRIVGSNAWDRARADASDGDSWEKQVSGVEMIVSIARDRPELLRTDMKRLVRTMLEVLKNLRSQVSRAGAQAFGELFLHLGKAMEQDIDKTVVTLMQKSADTNKFIRESSNEALDVMMENVTAIRAVQCVIGSMNHKSPVVRTAVARLLDKMITQLGSEMFMGSSKDFQELIMREGSKMLTDGSLDVRKHAKHLFGVLIRHRKFDSLLHSYLKENERRDIKKALDSLL